MSTLSHKKVRAYLLIAPLFVFILIFFLWPLYVMATKSIYNPAVSNVLINTRIAIKSWDGKSPPTPAMKAAFLKDVIATKNLQEIGNMTIALNDAQPGFRTLMSNTMNSVELDDPIPPLEEMDKRWDDPIYWQAIKRLIPPFTSRYLLASLDMKLTQHGNIKRLPSDQSANVEIYLRTFWIGFLVTVFGVVIGYPYAILLAKSKGWLRNLLFMAVLLPLWTSLLVRTAAWYILLQDKGIINTTLIKLGIISQPLHMLFDRVGVVIAMTHVLLPFMVLPIYSVVKSIPSNLMRAATSLGAHPWKAFFRVYLPLSFKGILSGMLLVFMSAIGYYITPALIGGPKDQMISSIIAYYSLDQANWGMAGALGIILIIVCMVLFSVYQRLTADEPRRT